MAKFWALLFSVYLILPTFCTPIIDSENVGYVFGKGKNAVVTGQRFYPYAVRIETIVTVNGKRISEFCMGVVIGLDAVLTAGHCLYNRVDPEVILYAGVVDWKLENKIVQKINAKDFLVHKNYQEECDVGPDHYCFNVNDIAIVWTEKNFKLGNNLKIATLSKDLKKPFGKKGHIVGWGYTGKAEPPTMLQKGLVKVVHKGECKNFNTDILIQDTMMCLAPVNKNTRASRGDSGGPFVIDDVVYGISSITIFDSASRKKYMGLFTCVAEYRMWIRNNLSRGAPKQRLPKSSKKPGASKI